MSEAKNAVAAVNADRAGEEYVSVRLFKDSGKYKDDLLVCVNGESCLIQRGVTVAVPEYIAEVLESSQREDENAALRMERAERSYMDRLSKAV